MVLRKLTLILHRNSEEMSLERLCRTGCETLKIKGYAYRFNHQSHEHVHFIGQFIRERQRNGQRTWTGTSFRGICVVTSVCFVRSFA